MKRKAGPPRGQKAAVKPLEDLPFSERVEHDPELAAVRREHAGMSEAERLQAAQWSYDAGVSDYLWGQMMAGKEGGIITREPQWPSGYLSLAIEPRFAPGLLTVGSIEYQLGRKEEAMNLFMTLTTLSPETEDLSKIIDKAGDFLLDAHDYEAARQLYGAAAAAFPQVALYLDALGFCLSKLGLLEEALEAENRALALEPENYKILNDVGWSLVLLKRFDEARTMLEKAVALAPPDYEFARNNLEQLAKEQRKSARKPSGAES